jgi:hypothetical protein
LGKIILYFPSYGLLDKNFGAQKLKKIAQESIQNFLSYAKQGLKNFDQLKAEVDARKKEYRQLMRDATILESLTSEFDKLYQIQDPAKLHKEFERSSAVQLLKNLRSARPTWKYSKDSGTLIFLDPATQKWKSVSSTELSSFREFPELHQIDDVLNKHFYLMDKLAQRSQVKVQERRVFLPQEKGLFRAANFLDSEENEHDRQLLRQVMNTVMPLESQRGSGFVARIEDWNSSPLLFSASHVTATEVSGQKSGVDVVRQSISDFIRNPPINISFDRVDTNLRVHQNHRSGQAELVFTPPYSRNEMAEKFIKDHTSDFSVSQIISAPEDHGADWPHLPISMETPKPGEAIYLIGFPGMTSNDRSLAFSRGHLLDPKEVEHKTRDFGAPIEKSSLKGMLFTDAAALKGMSGGLAVNQLGEAMGIIEGGIIPPGMHPISAMREGMLVTQIVPMTQVLKELKKSAAELTKAERAAFMTKINSRFNFINRCRQIFE